MVNVMKELTGRHVLIILLSFFGVILVANVIFVYVATSTFNKREAVGAYERGLHYNKLIEEEKAQNALGWAYKVALPDTKTVTISFTDKNAAPVKGLTIRGEIRRRATEKFSQDLTFVETQPGLYSTAVNELASGEWVVILTAVVNEDGKERTVYRVKEIQWLTPKS